MSYVLAAYGIALGCLAGYALYLVRERRHLRAALERRAIPTPSENPAER